MSIKVEVSLDVSPALVTLQNTAAKLGNLSPVHRAIGELQQLAERDACVHGRDGPGLDFGQRKVAGEPAFLQLTIEAAPPGGRAEWLARQGITGTDGTYLIDEVSHPVTLGQTSLRATKVVGVG